MPGNLISSATSLSMTPALASFTGVASFTALAEAGDLQPAHHPHHPPHGLLRLFVDAPRGSGDRSHDEVLEHLDVLGIDDLAGDVQGNEVLLAVHHGRHHPAPCRS